MFVCVHGARGLAEKQSVCQFSSITWDTRPNLPQPAAALGPRCNQLVPSFTEVGNTEMQPSATHKPVTSKAYPRGPVTGGLPLSGPVHYLTQICSRTPELIIVHDQGRPEAAVCPWRGFG